MDVSLLGRTLGMYGSKRVWATFGSTGRCLLIHDFREDVLTPGLDAHITRLKLGQEA
jgi:hypothetical protein